MSKKINEKEMLLIIAQNIHHFRVLKNWSQQELEFNANLSACYISTIETCSNNDIRLSTLIKIANALGIELSELFIKRKEFKAKSRINFKNNNV